MCVYGVWLRRTEVGVALGRVPAERRERQHPLVQHRQLAGHRALPLRHGRRHPAPHPPQGHCPLQPGLRSPSQTHTHTHTHTCTFPSLFHSSGSLSLSHTLYVSLCLPVSPSVFSCLSLPTSPSLSISCHSSPSSLMVHRHHPHAYPRRHPNLTLTRTVAVARQADGTDEAAEEFGWKRGSLSPTPSLSHARRTGRTRRQRSLAGSWSTATSSARRRTACCCRCCSAAARRSASWSS